MKCNSIVLQLFLISAASLWRIYIFLEPYNQNYYCQTNDFSPCIDHNYPYTFSYPLHYFYLPKLDFLLNLKSELMYEIIHLSYRRCNILI